MEFRRAMAVLGACGCLAGCAAESSGPDAVPATGEHARISGDWDDVEAAVEIAVSKVQMAVMSSHEEEGSGRRVYTLVTITDEPGRLVVERRPSGAPTGAAETFWVEASVGRFGNPRQEQALIAALRERLGDLAGVDFAPLR